MTADPERVRRPLPGLRIVLAENPGPLTLDGTRSYVVGRSRLVVVDPGPDDPSHLERLIRVVAGRPVEAVCLTHSHPDHSAAAESASRSLGAPIAASPESLRRLGLRGRPLTEGERLEVDDGAGSLEAIHTPGHASDHLCYLWRPWRAVFTGDLVLGSGTSLIVHPDGTLGSYLASLARLVALRPALLFPGHGEPIAEPVRRLERYRAHRLMRTDQILDAIRRGAGSLEEIRRSVYGELPERLAEAAELSILAHLAYLREAGHELPPGLPL